MGVTGLWTVVQPCARPIKIETLNRKRLAVDASIWIYQFLKAVRDKEGNALRNSHVVGFFRRICKLLFFGIKPVFVFDGGAPALKRQTISGRKARREGRREDAVRTAGKLLALQMQRRAEEEEKKRKEELERPRVEEEALPENLVYVDELYMAPQERQQNRKFKKKDQYHLPDLDVSLAEMGGPNDPRVMSLEELQEYARQFDTGEDINVYDFSKIDFDSDFFTSLPASDRYNILNAARLRSRLRMGYSKEQLDTMFPDRMAFSRFQIERVRERNELTQRLMNLNGMVDDAIINGGGRVAGEKGREYVLVRNEGAEGGWALGVVTSKDEGERDRPINVDRSSPPVQEDEDQEFEEDEFEDIPIEGLNRLPKRTDAQPAGNKSTNELTRQRRAFYKSRRKGNTRGRRHIRPPLNEDPDSLFLAEDPEEDDVDEWENVDLDTAGVPDDLFEDQGIDAGEEDDDLQRAIHMSLQQDHPAEDEEPDDYVEVFQQAKVEEARPFGKGSAQAIARMANNRSSKAVAQFASSDVEQDDIDLQSALAESRRTKRLPRSSPKTLGRRASPIEQPWEKPAKAEQPQAGGFDGPLPFEKLDLGSSLLGKKKMQKIAEDTAGGFEKDTVEAKKKDVTPPPWFANNDIREGVAAQEAAEAERRERDRQLDEQFQLQAPPRLRQRDTLEVIDLDAPEPEPRRKEVINIDSEDEKDEDDVEMEDVVMEDPQLRMGDVADMVRVEPPQPSKDLDQATTRAHATPREDVTPSLSTQQSEKVVPEENDTARSLSEDEPYEWEESDHEADRGVKPPKSRLEPAVGNLATQPDDARSASPEFENVPIAQPLQPSDGELHDETDEVPVPMSGNADQYVPIEDTIDLQHEETYSDPEDEELFRQLAVEAEEHARFASTLNNKSQQQNAIDYERELKQLRNQQKRDRRDADEVTQTMIAECQQLLSLFGLPYITAPMEAEAQCAELVRLNLVDGIVTDDSDIFLFGGTRVYKNMFNQAKFVECYLSTDLEAEFSLTRGRLISIAQLLGSDYTEGLPGVGPVTALEVLSEFDDLTSFKEWWTAVQNGSRKKEEDKSNPFRRKFRKNATKLFLPPSFPDRRVTEAYLKPEVDSDPSQFVWGVPDLDALRSFLMATIGWTQERTDEVLVPVIRDMNTRQAEGTQSNITAYFGGAVGAGAFAPRQRAEGKSKRLENALGRMAARAGRSVAEDEEPAAPGEVQEEEKGGTQAKGNPDANGTSRKPKRSMPATPASDSSAEDDEYAEPRKRAKKKGRGGSKAGGKRSKVQVTTS